MLSIIKDYAGKKPMLGVCLGHQAIGESFGGTLQNMNNVLHGISTPVTVTAKCYLFDNLPETFEAGRYHSWIVEKKSLPVCLEVTSLDEQGRRQGWWQITGRSDKPMHLHTEDDLYYIQNYSIWLDIQILIRTIWAVLIGKGSY